MHLRPVDQRIGRFALPGRTCPESLGERRGLAAVVEQGDGYGLDARTIGKGEVELHGIGMFVEKPFGNALQGDTIHKDALEHLHLRTVVEQPCRNSPEGFAARETLHEGRGGRTPRKQVGRDCPQRLAGSEQVPQIGHLGAGGKEPPGNRLQPAAVGKDAAELFDTRAIVEQMLGDALQRIAIVETGTQVGQFRTSGEQVGGNLPQGIAAVESLGKGRHTGERSLGPGRGYRFERSTSVKSILHFFEARGTPGFDGFQPQRLVVGQFYRRERRHRTANRYAVSPGRGILVGRMPDPETVDLGINTFHSPVAPVDRAGHLTMQRDRRHRRGSLDLEA